MATAIRKPLVTGKMRIQAQAECDPNTYFVGVGDVFADDSVECRVASLTYDGTGKGEDRKAGQVRFRGVWATRRGGSKSFSGKPRPIASGAWFTTPLAGRGIVTSRSKPNKWAYDSGGRGLQWRSKQIKTTRYASWPKASTTKGTYLIGAGTIEQMRNDEIECRVASLTYNRLLPERTFGWLTKWDTYVPPTPTEASDPHLLKRLQALPEKDYGED